MKVGEKIVAEKLKRKREVSDSTGNIHGDSPWLKGQRNPIIPKNSKLA